MTIEMACYVGIIALTTLVSARLLALGREAATAAAEADSSREGALQAQRDAMAAEMEMAQSDVRPVSD